MRRLLNRILSSLGENTGKTFLSMAVTALSKLLGFVRTALFAALFGATGQTDAYYMASSISSLLAGAAGSLSGVVVPMRTKMLAEQGKQAADRLDSMLIGLSSAAMLLLSVLCVLFAPQVVALFAPNYQGETLDMTVHMLRILAPFSVLQCIYLFSGSLLDMHRRYVLTAAGGLVLNVVSIALGVALVGPLGVFALPACAIASMVANVLVRMIGLRGRFRFTLRWDFKDPNLRAALAMWIPIAIGTLTAIINQTVDKVLSSGLVAGSLTSLGYAQQLTTLVSGILVQPAIAPLYTVLSAQMQEGKMEDVKRLVSRALSSSTVILVPVVALAMLFYREIVTIVFARGAFDEAAVGLTALAFLMYAPAILTGAYGDIAGRCFYAARDTKTPLLISAVSIAVNIASSILLVPRLAVGGIALGTSIASVCTLFLWFVALRRKLGPLGLSLWAKEALKVALAALLMCAAALLAASLAGPSALLRFVVAVAAGGVVYLAALLALRQRDLIAILKRIKR